MPEKPAYKELEQKLRSLEKRCERLKQAEKLFKKSNEQFQLLMDSLDALVYVVDMDTYEVLFINKYGRELLGDITGRICWQSIQQGQSGPCDFCTNKFLLTADGTPGEVYIWEFQNTITGKWFHIHDRAIEWSDGRIVRLEIATDITGRKKVEEELLLHKDKLELLVNKRTAELLQKNLSLEESNIAMKVLMKQQEAVKKDLEKNILFNVDKLIAPSLEKLKKKITDKNLKVYLEIIESNLEQIIAPFAPALSGNLSRLTPAEIQIADLVRQGKTTNEIAGYLGLSPTTIATHRQNIRKKLALTNKKLNLRTVLAAKI